MKIAEWIQLVQFIHRMHCLAIQCGKLFLSINAIGNDTNLGAAEAYIIKCIHGHCKIYFLDMKVCHKIMPSGF